MSVSYRSLIAALLLQFAHVGLQPLDLALHRGDFPAERFEFAAHANGSINGTIGVLES
jgi:hypothetical protein